MRCSRRGFLAMLGAAPLARRQQTPFRVAYSVDLADTTGWVSASLVHHVTGQLEVVDLVVLDERHYGGRHRWVKP